MLTLDVRPYHRPFRQPLHTHHGLWKAREGLILRLENDRGQVRFGEVAPIPWFGTETLAMARAFCDRWPQQFSPKQIATIPPNLPACQFGFGTAVQGTGVGDFQSEDEGFQPDARSPTQVCGLLPAGAPALEAWSALWQAGHRSFKWKIGVAEADDEITIFQTLMARLPDSARVRLDANGGLTPETARAWLLACDDRANQVEFLEQPLPPDRILDWLPQSTAQFKTAIALDESVATFHQLRQVHQRIGNRAVYVIKPAIAGFPDQLLTFCTQHRLDVVISSALETVVGGNAVLTLAQQLWAGGVPKRVLGFGVSHLFADDWDSLTEEALWQSL